MDDDRRAHGPHYPEPPFPEQTQRPPGLESRMTPRPLYLGERYRAAGKLEGKVALVTGGDSGIGRAVAVLYAREGADVALVYLRSEESDARETLRAVEAQGRRCLLLPGDVGSPKFCKRAVETTVKRLGGLHVLVNNAAYQKSQEDIADLSDAQWDRTFRTNIHGYFYMARAALKHMGDGGAIVNCGSVVSFRGSENLLDYSATKGAIAAFTKSLAAQLVGRRIRVNCVAPGPVWTPLNVSDAKKNERTFGKKVPLERPAQPEEIAPAFVFFASEADSSFVTGQTLPLTGGEIVGS
jgi:NAD(P)-dependent dehydrogenase (short-subunit alcohol dehydrogenase family)